MKRIVGAFVTGGCIGVTGQLFISLLSVKIPDPTLTVLISMLFVGIVGAVLIITGVYSKISERAGIGADIPICGLMFGAAGFRAKAQEDGMGAKQAVMQGFMKVMTIILIGFVVSFVIGIFA